MGGVPGCGSRRLEGEVLFVKSIADLRTVETGEPVGACEPHPELVVLSDP
jgi:hypothetical protein